MITPRDRDPAPTRLTIADRANSLVSFVGGLIGILVFIGGIGVWATGGLKWQSEVDLQSLRNQLTNIQTAQDRIAARLDSYPRPTDFAEVEAHLARVDNAMTAASERLTVAVQAVADRMTRDEVATADLAGRLSAMPLTRNPR